MSSPVSPSSGRSLFPSRAAAVARLLNMSKCTVHLMEFGAHFDILVPLPAACCPPPPPQRRKYRPFYFCASVLLCFLVVLLVRCRSVPSLRRGGSGAVIGTAHIAPIAPIACGTASCSCSCISRHRLTAVFPHARLSLKSSLLLSLLLPRRPLVAAAVAPNLPAAAPPPWPRPHL